MTIELLRAGLAGALLGLVHFGLLWLTLRGLHRAPHPGRRLALSTGLRLVAVVLAIAWVGGEEPLRWLAAVAGLWLVRQPMMLLPGPRNTEGA